MKKKTELGISIGNNIKNHRLSLGLIQKELADKIGVNSATVIANYESGYSIPPDNIKISLASLFDITLNELMGIDTKEEFETKYAEYLKDMSDEDVKRALQIYKNIKDTL